MQHNNDVYFERRITTLEMQFERIDKKLDELVKIQKDFVIQSQEVFATKQDSKETEKHLSNEINRLDISTKQEIKSLEISTKQEIKNLETTLNNKIDKLALVLNHNIDNSVNRMAWKICGFIVGVATVYPFAIQYLNKFYGI